MPSAQPSKDDLLECIFAYRAFDLRDRFPQPLETFRQALECLQSRWILLTGHERWDCCLSPGGPRTAYPRIFFHPSDR